MRFKAAERPSARDFDGQGWIGLLTQIDAYPAADPSNPSSAPSVGRQLDNGHLALRPDSARHPEYDRLNLADVRRLAPRPDRRSLVEIARRLIPTALTVADGPRQRAMVGDRVGGGRCTREDVKTMSDDEDCRTPDWAEPVLPETTTRSTSLTSSSGRGMRRQRPRSESAESDRRLTGRRMWGRAVSTKGEGLEEDGRSGGGKESRAEPSL